MDFDKKEMMLDDFINEDITIVEIAKVVNFYLRWGKIVKYFFVGLSCISILYGIMMMNETDGGSLIYCLLSIAFLGYGNIFENDVKCKAFTLRAHYLDKK